MINSVACPATELPSQDVPVPSSPPREGFFFFSVCEVTEGLRTTLLRRSRLSQFNGGYYREEPFGRPPLAFPGVSLPYKDAAPFRQYPPFPAITTLAALPFTGIANPGFSARGGADKCLEMLSSIGFISVTEQQRPRGSH